ncbi:MAG TPA: TRASH domain-containing protein [Planctomycetota bacterium]
MTTLLLVALLQKAPATTKEAMKPVQLLVGEWRVEVDGPADADWGETQAWEYKIDGQVYGLQFTIKDGKRFKDGALSYDLKKQVYRLDATRADGAKAAFEGKLTDKELVLEEKAAEGAAAERITYNLLRDNRFIGMVEKREAGQKVFAETHQYQFTRAGVSIVKVEAPKCVVTGGSSQIPVMYGDKTYYVCCSTCRKEFQANPAKVLENAKKEGFIK